jgi:hypothetical protein
VRAEERARERRKLILRGLQRPVFVVNFKGTLLGISLKGQLLEATGKPTGDALQTVALLHERSPNQKPEECR